MPNRSKKEISYISKENPFEKVVIKIDGMTCEHCVSRVNQALENRDGVVVKNISIGKVVANIHNDITNQEIKDIVKEAGYTIVKIKL